MITEDNLIAVPENLYLYGGSILFHILVDVRFQRFYMAFVILHNRELYHFPRMIRNADYIKNSNHSISKTQNKPYQKHKTELTE